jgi:hypothetical protein
VAGHEAVGDQEGDRLGDVVGLAHAADRRLRGIALENGLSLVVREDSLPRRIDDARRDAVHADRLEFDGEDRD